jgi:hypothetical protein
MTDAEAACFLIPGHTAYIALVSRAKLAGGRDAARARGRVRHGRRGDPARARARRAGAGVGRRSRRRARSAARSAPSVVLDHHAADFAKQVLAATGGRGAERDLRSGRRRPLHEGDPVHRSARDGCSRSDSRAGAGASADTAHRRDAQLLRRRRDPVRLRPGVQGAGAGTRCSSGGAPGRLRIAVDEVVPFDPRCRRPSNVSPPTSVKGKLALAVDPKATSHVSSAAR